MSPLITSQLWSISGPSLTYLWLGQTYMYTYIHMYIQQMPVSMELWECYQFLPQYAYQNITIFGQ